MSGSHRPRSRSSSEKPGRGVLENEKRPSARAVEACCLCLFGRYLVWELTSSPSSAKVPDKGAGHGCVRRATLAANSGRGSRLSGSPRPRSRSSSEKPGRGVLENEKRPSARAVEACCLCLFGRHLVWVWGLRGAAVAHFGASWGLGPNRTTALGLTHPGYTPLPLQGRRVGFCAHLRFTTAGKILLRLCGASNPYLAPPTAM